jgi:putative membrane protein
MNEVGTLFLVAIVFLVVMKDSVSWVWGSVGLVGTGFLMAFIAKKYKSWRERNNQG